MKYESFKNRKIELNTKTFVYRNLHTGNYSVKQNGLVIAHVESIILNNCSFKISEKLRQKVIKDKQKNVHAYIVGYVESYKDINSIPYIENRTSITYNPYKFKTFVYKEYETEAILQPNYKICCSTEQGVFIFQRKPKNESNICL